MPRAPPVLFRPVGNPGLRKRRVDGKRRVGGLGLHGQSMAQEIGRFLRKRRVDGKRRLGDPALPEQCVDAVRR